MIHDNHFNQNVKQQLVDFYEGALWVTEPFKIKVASLPESVALQKKEPFVYSIAGQVAHMAAWRNFVHQKISGNSAFNIEDNSPEDWPQVSDWSEVLRIFEQSQQDLLKDLDTFDLQRMNDIVPGRSYSFSYLLTGIVQHDLYHYGQIGTILAVFNRMAI